MKTKTLTLLGGIVTSALASYASSDYGPAVWHPCCNANWYTTGYGHKFCVIHDMEGYYGSTVSYFTSCSHTTSSVYYAVNGLAGDSGDGSSPAGEVSQMVLEANYAWHACCWNQYAFGTEHEGFQSNPAWYTEDMYQSSGDLHRHLCNTYGIAKDRNHIVAHGEKSNANWVSYCNANFGCSATCNTHTDPGAYWDWNHFMSIINQVQVNYATVPFGPIAKNNDGHLEVFINGRNSHRPWHGWQTTPNGTWSSFADMGSTIVFKPGVESQINNDGRVEIFAVGTNNTVYHNWQTSPGASWNGWVSFGGNVSGIVTSANADGRLEVFQIGAATGYVWHRYQTNAGGNWTSSWYQLGSTAVTALSAIPNLDGRVEIFGVTPGGSVVHMYQTAPNGSWSDWYSMGGSGLQSQIATARNADGRLEVYTVGVSPACVYHQYQTRPSGSFVGSWYNLGDSSVTQVAVGANQDGHLELFTLHTDTSIAHLWQKSANGGWTSSWANLGGSSLSLAVGSNADGRLEVLAVGNSSKSLWHMWQTTPNGNFSSWADLGGNWENTF